MKKNILIIGANSVFAKAFINFLPKEYFNIITAGRKNCNLKIDIIKSFDIPEDINIVVNFATSFGRNFDKEFKNAIDTNIKGTFNICKACKKVEHLILISSIFTNKPNDNVYSLTKNMADNLAKYYCKANEINLTILKPSQIYGNNNCFAKNQPFFYNIIEKAQNDIQIYLYGKNKAKRNYIHVEDLCKILLLIIEKKVFGIFDTINPKDLSYLIIAKTALKVFGSKKKVEFLPNKPDIPDNIFEYNDKLYKIIDFYPQIDIETGLKKIKEYNEVKK